MTPTALFSMSGAIFAAIACLLFVVSYAVVGWWRTPEGKNVMALAVSLLALIGVTLARRFVGLEAAQGVAGVALFAIGGVMLWRAALLRRAQRDYTADHPTDPNS